MGQHTASDWEKELMGPRTAAELQNTAECEQGFMWLTSGAGSLNSSLTN